MRKTLLYFSAVMLFLISCAGTKRESVPVTREDNIPLQETKSPWVQNPRKLEEELVMKIHIDQVYKGRRLIQEKRKSPDFMKSYPALYVWCPEPVNNSRQKVESVHYSLPPAFTYEDEQGNRISFWNLTSRLPSSGSDVIELRRTISMTRYETEFDIDPEEAEGYDEESFLFQRYTKSEPGVEITDDIRRKAEEIVGSEKNPWKKARLIFRWVVENLEYHYPPEKRGAKYVFDTRRGDCGEYAYLFCALCRAVDAPARFVSGLWFRENPGYHAWAEFYLPPFGWIPADPSLADSDDAPINWYYFGGMENHRATMSRGNNLPIKGAPDWVMQHNEEIRGGETPFMQFSTLASFAVDYRVEKEFRLIRDEPVKEEADEWTSFR